MPPRLSYSASSTLIVPLRLSYSASSTLKVPLRRTEGDAWLLIVPPSGVAPEGLAEALAQLEAPASVVLAPEVTAHHARYPCVGSHQPT